MFLFKMVALVILSVLTLCGYLAIQAIIGYSIISVIIITYLIYKLLRMIGLFVMYPGSFRYYKGII